MRGKRGEGGGKREGKEVGGREDGGGREGRQEREEGGGREGRKEREKGGGREERGGGRHCECQYTYLVVKEFMVLKLS